MVHLLTVWLLSPLILTIVMVLCLNIPSHAIALITLASRIMQQDNQFSKGKKYETEKYFIYRHGWNNIVL